MSAKFQRLLNAIKQDRFNYPCRGGKKNFYGLELNVTKLVWARNRGNVIQKSRCNKSARRGQIDVYSKVAIHGLIKMGYPFCPRCGGKLSAV